MGKLTNRKVIFALVTFSLVLITVYGCWKNENGRNSGGTTNISPSVKSANSTVATLPNRIHMLDQQNGYGWSADYPVLVTSNGGSTWIDITPQSPKTIMGQSFPSRFIL